MRVFRLAKSVSVSSSFIVHFNLLHPVLQHLVHRAFHLDHKIGSELVQVIFLTVILRILRERPGNAALLREELEHGVDFLLGYALVAVRVRDKAAVEARHPVARGVSGFRVTETHQSDRQHIARQT